MLMGTSIDELESFAQSNNCELYQAAAFQNSPAVKSPAHWPDPMSNAMSESIKSKDIDLTGGSQDLLSRFVRNISAKVKFPVSTAYLHALGCVASAMTKSFTFEYHGKEKAVNLYVVTAQPPASGKSGINEYLFDPISDAYDVINESNRVIRRKLKREISFCEAELKKSKNMSPDVECEIYDRLEKAESAIKKTPEWEPMIDDTTIEGAEACAAEQTGMFNIVSAEAESINVVTGAVYGDDKSSNAKNLGLLLKAWDNEKVSVSRSSRAGYKGRARASISVIAQNQSVESLLKTGAGGRGLAERFLLLLEDDMLGKRKMLEHIELRTDLEKQYRSMVSNIVNEKYVKLVIPDACSEIIRNYRAGLEPEMLQNGKYEHDLLTGFMGKADKHIIKIACVLHACEYWQDGAGRLSTMQDDTIYQAIEIFINLSKTYITAADFMGFVGGNSETLKAMEYLEAKAQKGTLKVRVSQMVNDLKNVKPFKGSRKITEKIRAKTLPELESLIYCCVVNNTIYINPRLK